MCKSETLKVPYTQSSAGLHLVLAFILLFCLVLLPGSFDFPRSISSSLESMWLILMFAPSPTVSCRVPSQRLSQDRGAHTHISFYIFCVIFFVMLPLNLLLFKFIPLSILLSHSFFGNNHCTIKFSYGFSTCFSTPALLDIKEYSSFFIFLSSLNICSSFLSLL